MLIKVRDIDSVVDRVPESMFGKRCVKKIANSCGFLKELALDQVGLCCPRHLRFEEAKEYDFGADKKRRVLEIIGWILKNTKEAKAWHSRHDSYSFKGRIERDVGYITNGEAILAMYELGIPMRFSLDFFGYKSKIASQEANVECKWLCTRSVSPNVGFKIKLIGGNNGR